MRPLGVWLPVFIVLFVCYQAPEGIGGLWLHNAAIAATLMCALLPIAWLVALRLGMAFGAAYALEWDRRAAVWLGSGFALALVAKGAALAIGAKLGIYALASPASFTAVELAKTIAWLALSTFIPSLAEDIVTRGFWARVPDIDWTPVRFVLLSSVLYVVNHIYRVGNGPTEWSMLFCFGLAYAAAFWTTGSLWAAVGLHWGWNFAGQAFGEMLPSQMLDVTSSRLLSASLHLTLLVVAVVLMPRLGHPLTTNLRR